MKIEYIGFIPTIIIVVFAHYYFAKHGFDPYRGQDMLMAFSVVILMFFWLSILLAGVLWGAGVL